MCRMSNRNCGPYTTLRANSRSTGFPVAKHALDDPQIVSLKRRKLLVKDELARLKH
jgi:hypothetical protein